MPYIKRIVAMHCPHHITNRGNRRQPIFFRDEDRFFYLNLLHRYAKRFGLYFLAYCLMPNHIHLVAVPLKIKSMSLTIRETHRRFSIQINLIKNWQGTLWQRRYYSFPLEGSHLFRALRYVENNPVRAGLVKRAEDYPWSSAPAHVLGRSDLLVLPNKLDVQKSAWSAYLREVVNKAELEEIRKRSISGRPLGGDDFITHLGKSLGRDLKIKSPGRKKIDKGEID